MTTAENIPGDHMSMHWETKYKLEQENKLPTTKNQHRKQQPNTWYLTQTSGNKTHTSSID
jgi:hypothetical protein